MGLNKALILSCFFCAPIDIEDEKCKSKCILIGYLISPGSVLFRPGDITIIDEFGLISLLEIFLEDFLLCLDGEVFVEATPVVEVIVIKAKLLSQEVCQHENIIIPLTSKNFPFFISRQCPTPLLLLLFIYFILTRGGCIGRYIMMNNHKKSSILDLFPEEV